MTHSIHQIGKDIIVCSDEEFKTCDYVIDDSCKQAWMIQVRFDSDLSKYKKVIASNCGIGLPLTNSIENLNELWEEFESERLALINSEIELPNHIPQDFNTEIWISGARIIGFKEGRKSKQGVYTLEDMYMLASKVVGDIAKNYSNADWNLFTTPKMIADEFISQLSIHEGKVSCEITNDSITVTKYL